MTAARHFAYGAVTALFLTIAAHGDDELDGGTLYTERGCGYCHGPQGKEPVLSEYPKLAGQNEQYLLQQMLDIRSTVRKNGYTGMMQPAVINVSDEEFAAIAAYLAAL